MDIADEIAAERAALADSLEAVGPQAGTACGDWTSFDLAAHVVASDRGAGVPAYCVRALAARGLRLRPHPRIVGLTIARQRRDGYPGLVARIRGDGPRLLVSTSVAPSTLLELWMHHDDLTSVNDLTHHTPEHLALAIPPLASYQARYLPEARLVMRTTDGFVWRCGPQDATEAVITGPTTDLVRWLSGRRLAAPLSIDADGTLTGQLRGFAGRIG